MRKVNTQKVNACRPLIKESIEEKIRAPKAEATLAEDVLGEENFAQMLTMNDLHYLFAEWPKPRSARIWLFSPQSS
jgi:hypothetical protein